MHTVVDPAVYLKGGGPATKAATKAATYIDGLSTIIHNEKGPNVELGTVYTSKNDIGAKK